MKWISLGIALLYVIFFAYAVYTFYEAPKNPCDKYMPEMNITKENVTNGTNYNEAGYYKKYDDCYKGYKEKLDKHNFNSFIILSIISIISMILSLYIANKTISYGILGGGILLLIYSSLRYWSDVGRLVRLILIGLGIGALIYISIKKKL